MYIGLAGTRGSIPTPTGKTFWNGEINTAKYGGNTTCVYVRPKNDEEFLLDIGTGARGLGIHMAKDLGFNGKAEKGLHVCVSHTHWDHIQALPFFVPAYIPGNRIQVYGDAKIELSNGNGRRQSTRQGLETAMSQHSQEVADGMLEVPELLQVSGIGLQDVLRDQQKVRNFPADLGLLKGIICFNDFIAGRAIYISPTLRVDTQRANHPNGCISYRFTERDLINGGNVVVVFSTDFEPGNPKLDEELKAFWAGADLVIADGQYAPLRIKGVPNQFQPTWGHSDRETNLTWATEVGVKKLILTHHEPKMNDADLDLDELAAKEFALAIADKMQKRPVEVELAKEGTFYEL